MAVDVTQAVNDKQQLQPMLDKVAGLPDELGEGETMLADSGYFSAANVMAACAAAEIEPLIAMGRQPHYPPLERALRVVAPTAAGKSCTPVEAMAQRLAEDAGGQEALCPAQAGA